MPHTGMAWFSPMADVDSNKPEVPLVNVQIDGEWHQFPKGTRMIEACREAGKEVPHYCYHPKLTSPGNCRMCLVEMGMPPRSRPGDAPPEKDEDGFLPIGWMPRPAIACANTVAENMGIRTDSDLTKQCREGVMEFLLINHPLDCPICDQAGECRLQEFSVEHGTGGSRFREEKVHKPKNVDIGPRIRLDDERCIMCSRCIRFMDEVADDPVLGFTERGSHTVLSVHPGKELDSNYSLNTVDICPVGALTSNDFRFSMRVWFLKETKSIDVSCGTGCNITIHSRENRVHRITPRDNAEVNSSWMPDSHRLNFHHIDGPNRLTAPMIREGTKHREVGWTAAFERFRERVSGFAPEETAVIASGRMTNEELYLTKKLVQALEAKYCDIVPRMETSDGYLIAADRNPNTEGAKLILKLGKPGEKLAEIREGVLSGKIRCLLVLGDDATEGGFDSSDLYKAECLITLGMQTSDSAQASDVVFAGASWAEKRGSMINAQGRLQRLNAAISVVGQCRDDWEVLRDMRAQVTGTNGLYGVDEVFRAMAKEIPDFEGLSLGKIGDLGVPLVNTGVRVPLLDREAERRAKGLIVG
ncbi:MAG: molybdopterin-dependent oxidoreductase [Verrucomicrobiota bacterium]